MRSILVVLVSTFTNVAAAHPLTEQHGIIDRVSHHVLSLHHLPVILLVVFVGLLALATTYHRNRD